ncbi:MAG: dipeptidase PepE [bacterium]
MKRNLLLISNSTNAGESYLAWPRKFMQEFLEKFRVRKVLFIPFAGVNLTPAGVEKSFDVYEERVKGVFKELGFGLESVHRKTDPLHSIMQAEAIVVGGGNTFHLVKVLHETGMMKAIHERVLAGIPFMGWSAGANVACPTMRTTNDMPISQPFSFDCLGLVPFQINPHYLDVNPAGHGGETREQRILEFLTVNREIYVAGLREASLFRIEGNKIKLMGARSLRVFRFGKEPVEIAPGKDCSFLLANS